MWARGARKEEEGILRKKERREEKVGKDEESVGGSGPGDSLKKTGTEGKEEGDAGACGERSSVMHLTNDRKAGGYSIFDILECKLDIIYFKIHSRYLTN